VRRMRWLEIDGDGTVDRRCAWLGDRHAGQADLALLGTGMVLESVQGGTCLPGDEQRRQQQESSYATQSSHALLTKPVPWGEIYS